MATTTCNVDCSYCWEALSARLDGEEGPVQLLAPAYDSTIRLGGASPQHFAHESAAWNLALGIGFVWVACRPVRTSGVVPTLATFVAAGRRAGRRPVPASVV